MRLQYDPSTGFFDIALTPRGGIDAGYGNGGALEAAIWVSLFTDAMADPGDLTPDLGSDRRGWWFDTDQPSGFRMGSQLWLQMRAKKNERTRLLVENEARAALQWLIDDGIAIDVAVTASFPDRPADAIAIVVTTTEPDGKSRDWKVDLLWGGVGG